MTEIPWRFLDPGVRDLVRQLVDLGFTPTDSGDGVSKVDAGRVFDFLHVFMRTEPEDLIDEAKRLQVLLPVLDVPGLVVEASYRPSDGVGILFLFCPPEELST